MDNHKRKNRLILMSIIIAIFIWVMVMIGEDTPNDVGQVYIHEYNLLPTYTMEIVEQGEVEVVSNEVIVDKPIRVETKTPSRSIEGGRKYIGTFELTAYCACTKCCGANAKGITASGTKVKEGRTIAVDTKIIPMGTKVYIEGVGERTAEDKGGAIKGNIIDVYHNSHQSALNFGRQKGVKVYIIGGDKD